MGPGGGDPPDGGDQSGDLGGEDGDFGNLGGDGGDQSGGVADGEGVSLGPPDAATAALSDALDQSVETAALEGVPLFDLSSFAGNISSSPQGGWASTPQDTGDPYSGVNTSGGALACFVGQDVDQFSGGPRDTGNGNQFTGGQNIEPISGLASPAVYSDGSDGASTSTVSAATPSVNESPANPAGAANAGGASVSGWTLSGDRLFTLSIDANGNRVVNEWVGPLPQDLQQPPLPQTQAQQTPPSPQVTQSTVTPAQTPPSVQLAQPSTAPAVQPTIAAPAPDLNPASIPRTAPLTTSPSAAPEAEPSWGLGDIITTITSLFAPGAVGPYLHPQTPANLPAGLQQMGQQNAGMAQQSMQLTGLVTRSTILTAGAPYALTEAALATGALFPLAARSVGTTYSEAGIRLAARLPTPAITVATEAGNALTGAIAPRVTAAGAIGVAGAFAANEIRAVGPSAPVATQVAMTELETFAPSASQELPAVSAEVQNALPSELPALAPESGSDLEEVMELNRLFGQKVQENAAAMRDALDKGDTSLLEQWLYTKEFASYQRGQMQAANMGKAIERMVASDLALDSRTAPYIGWMSGANQPDFYGIGKAQGFFWDVTTELGKFVHEQEIERWYASRTFVWGY